MIRILLTSLTLLLLTTAAHARTRVEVEGGRVTVETKRYRVVVDGLTMTHVENRLTGETYTAPPASVEPSPALQSMLADRGVSIESLRPAVPVRRFGITERTRITSRKRGDRATVTYVGLQHGDEFDADLTISLSLRVERKTGDLLITPNVTGNIELVHGVRDRGVLRNSFHLLHLADSLKVIVPASQGHAFTASDVARFATRPERGWHWPQHWEAALVVLESEKGCLGFWADEPTLQYGRYLSLGHSQATWNLGFEYETSRIIWECDEITDATWRFNVFAGYWANAAARYVEQMKRDGMKLMSEKTPAWAAKVRVSLHGLTPHAAEYARLVPRDTIINPTWQGWLRGYTTGEWKEGIFPNWPPDYPVRWEAGDGIEQRMREAEAVGVHVFPYTNPTCVWNPEHAWLKEKMQGRQFFAWRIWQRLQPEFCLDLVQRYGVSGIYEDCSWVLGRHSAGAPDGDNWVQGSVHMREYFHKLMPAVAVMGEQNNEVTARGQHFALGSIGTSERTRHPICGYLFDPFILMFNISQCAGSYDDDDIRGFPITVWPSHINPDPMQEEVMIRKRGLVFAHEQLVSHWPPTWDTNVMHYWKGKDGAEYRFIRDRGTRFVKMRPDGGADTIYWRLRGVKEASAPGVGIEGWIGYDGDKIIGLNPNVPLYVTMDNVARPLAVISSVPEGYAIHRSVVRDGYWLAALDLADSLKQAPAPEAKEPKVERVSKTIRVRASKPVQLIGVESAKQIGDGEYELQVALPGGFAAYWSEPAASAAGPLLDASLATAHDRLSGVVCHRYPKPGFANAPISSGDVPAQEATTTWLIKLPPEPLRLTFNYGTSHGYGDGANYMVRVNGRELWKEYRPQISADPEEAKAHQAPPIATATVDLSAYAGETVILELANNGHHGGGSESLAWHNVRLEAP